MAHCGVFANCRLCVPRCKWVTLFNDTEICVYDLGKMGVRINTLAENRDECPREPEPVVFSATWVGIIVAGVVASIIVGAILMGFVWRKCGRRRMGQLAVQRNSGVRGRGRPSREKYKELRGDMEMSLLNVGRTSGQTDGVAHETDVDANGSDVSGVTRFGTGSGPTVVSAPHSPKYDVPTPTVNGDDDENLNARAIRWHRKGSAGKEGETVKIDI